MRSHADNSLSQSIKKPISSVINSEIQSILLVLPWSPALPGGVSVVVRNLSQHLPILTTVHPWIVISDWESSQLMENTEKIFNFRFALLGTTTWTGLIKTALTMPIRLIRTLKLLRLTKAQAVNFHYPSLDALGIALLKYLGLFNGRLILSFHGTDARPPESNLKKHLWRFIFAMSDGISACSTALAKQVAEAFTLSVKRITVIYNGVDADCFSPRAAASNHPANLPTRYLVSVGSYIPRKGQRVLLDAFARLCNEFPDVGLVITGMDGPERQSLLEQAAKIGLSSRLTFLVGLTPKQVATVLARAEICVQASFAEPFGLAVIEAGACGIPVVASAVGGHNELLRHQETGFLFPPGDAGACASILRQVLNDRESARNAAQRFRIEVLNRFTWEACARGYLALITKSCQ
jgi:glycosyltransferase involved in cell wall biosynthesis